MVDRESKQPLILTAKRAGVRVRARTLSLWLVRSALAGLVFLAVFLVQPAAIDAAQAKDGAELPVYIVRKGDTLSGIGHRHGLSATLLMSLNGLRSDRLKPGQRLILEPPASLAGVQTEPAVAGLRSVVESYLATPYRFGGSSREGLDCSAFVQQVFRELDITLPRSAREQYWYGDEVDRDDLRSGDLLFFRTYALYPSHVGIYLDEGKMAHASVRSHQVVVSDIILPYYRKRFIGAKRFAGIAPDRFDFTTLKVVLEESPESETEPAVQLP